MDVNPHLNKADTTVRNARYSALHPVIPRLYVPEWKTDMKNRTLLLQNAELGGIPNYEHDEPLFLEKREQMHYNVETRDRVDGRYVMAPRCELIHPPLPHHFARYRSSLMIRKFGEDPRDPERRPSPR